MIIEFTPDEMDTLRDAFNDVGNDCPGVDWDKFKALGVKLGFREAEKPPTEEELKRREEYNNSPTGKIMRELFARSNEQLAKMMLKDYESCKDMQWPIGAQLRIKLPNDYAVNKIEDKKK